MDNKKIISPLTCHKVTVSGYQQPQLALNLGEDIRLLLLALIAKSGRKRAGLSGMLTSEQTLRSLVLSKRWSLETAHFRTAEKQLFSMDALSITMIPIWQFHSILRCANPPLALFIRGDTQLLYADGMAIVGSRQASDSAQQWAAKMAIHSANHGFVIYSGGARGIDSAAHQAALDADQPTVAFMGVAADQIYPKENKSMFARILQRGGALVSEFPPGAKTYASDHAGRNRLIAASSKALYVAEAAARSGTLSTAHWAKRLGVPIFISPKHIGQQRAGLEQLIDAGLARVAYD